MKFQKSEGRGGGTRYKEGLGERRQGSEQLNSLNIKLRVEDLGFGDGRLSSTVWILSTSTCTLLEQSHPCSPTLIAIVIAFTRKNQISMKDPC